MSELRFLRLKDFRKMKKSYNPKILKILVQTSGILKLLSGMPFYKSAQRYQEYQEPVDWKD